MINPASDDTHRDDPELAAEAISAAAVHPLRESFEMVNSISDASLRLEVILQEAQQHQLSLSDYIYQLEEYNQATQQKSPILKPISVLDTKVSDFVAWLEQISIIKLATVLSEAAILIAFISYLFSLPYQQQKKIEDARRILVDQQDQQHSDGRIEALKTLNSFCASNAGLQASGAQMVGVQLNHCNKLSIGLSSFQQWPFRFSDYRGIDLSFANLQQANLAKANLKNANLNGSLTYLSIFSSKGQSLQSEDLSVLEIAPWKAELGLEPLYPLTP